ncbi:NAD(P)/FAD-dependent oxidoreductase [Nocardioides marmoriginsengisoli]|uniref:NAD(P)/FAD-dependent oxidoreductase n=1 Tax=Nocardioides marmoriginsengisoli TaxID=661483 RepID=A0A3N0CFQ5_9ACTN|nr:NAD(P)/FAD-dependent oxidoreductase [Nocardioides marmoriginsengisoli]RNL62292.1 NAD(P)/FAD-dependent oxidoreductase [Nocardioides marmoriginsengisoli]
MTDHDVIIVGAGFGGMGAAISLRRLGYENLLIIEREDDLGGTWHVNHYPGLAVDIASVTYSYSFEPNPHWKNWFARGAELKAYAEHVADKYDLRRHMVFGVRAEGARWDDEEKHWVVTTAPVAGGSSATRTARFLMTATGFLSQPKLPDIEGVEDFAGTVIHTAKWDDSVDLDGKRIGVIGTGATAVQLIPQIAKRAAALTVYQRTPIWVTPKNDFKIPKPVQAMFAAAPVTQRVARAANGAWLEGMMVTAVLHYKQAKFLNNGAAALAKAHLRRQVKDPETRRKLTPDYSFGCKRPTFSNDYYPTFNKEHVALETTPITKITPTGIVTSDGNETPIDVLVLATGFNLWDTNFPAFEVIGREGRDLGKSWRQTGYHAFEGVTVPGFPNFISLNSPYSYSGLSYFMTIEVQMRHLERLFGALREQDAGTFEISAEADAEFLGHMLERMDDTVFNQGSCSTARSYYYTNEGDAVLLRPTSSRNARKAVEAFPLEDYTFA